MKHNSARAVFRWFASFLAVAGLGMVIRVPPSQASNAIPVALVTCSTCQNAGDLLQAGLSYWLTYDDSTPSGYVGTLQDWGNCSDNPTAGPSIVLVVSTEVAISAGFSACWIYTARGDAVLRSYMIDGTSNADAVTNDNIIFARSAADAGHITMPSNLPFNGAGGNSFPDLWGEYLAGQLVLVGQEENLWHGILNYPQVLQGTFVNEQTGQKFEIWSGDTITVTDQNGWTAKFQWNPGADPQWQYVPNSMRDQKGNPVNTTGSNPPTNGGGRQPGGPYYVTLPPGWNSPGFYITLIYDDPIGPPKGTITVGPIGPDESYQCAVITAGNNCGG